MADLPTLVGNHEPTPDDPAFATPAHSGHGLRQRLRSLGLGPIHAALLALAIAILVVAIFIGRSLAELSGSTSSSSQVTSGKIALSDWVVWKRAAVPTAFKPMLEGADAVKPVGVAGVTVITGDIAADDIPTFLSGLQLAQVERRQLAAGRARANVYTAPLAAQPTVKTTAVLIPTRAGVSVAACVALVSDSGLAGNDCLTLLTTYLQMQGTPLAADRIDATQVDKLLTLIAAFGPARQRDSAALGKAQTSGAQADVARRLSEGYRSVASVASTISYSTLTRASGQSLTDALNQGASAYDALALAAERRSTADFRAARADVLAANAQIESAIRELGALGYAAR